MSRETYIYIYMRGMLTALDIIFESSGVNRQSKVLQLASILYQEQNPPQNQMHTGRCSRKKYDDVCQEPHRRDAAATDITM
ncbi:unnamed protein product [Brugia pahangi]|uniref:Uncharacterized protein n=1 Tax=Brugia pahangi TaxID=6280 RepID=A0A0N4SXY6_BRUPA|nr:unnamed protein product [Brugia pahangi]